MSVSQLINNNPWRWPVNLIYNPSELSLWYTHMQNSQIKVGYVHRTRWKRTDGRDPGFLRFVLTRSAIINSDSFISVVLMLYFLLLCLVCWGGIHSGRIELNWTWPVLSWPSYTARYWSDRPYWSCSQRDVVDWLQGRELPCVPKNVHLFIFWITLSEIIQV